MTWQLIFCWFQFFENFFFSSCDIYKPLRVSVQRRIQQLFFPSLSTSSHISWKNEIAHGCHQRFDSNEYACRNISRWQTLFSVFDFVCLIACAKKSGCSLLLLFLFSRTFQFMVAGNFILHFWLWFICHEGRSIYNTIL